MTEYAALEIDRPEPGRRRRRRKGIGRTLGRIAPGLIGAAIGALAVDVLGGGGIAPGPMLGVALVSGLVGWGVLRLLQPATFG
ncbi:MAG: hypothetical protein ACOYJ6_11040 [Caulobacterales bacterium]|jgi:hypothetical protein